MHEIEGREEDREESSLAEISRSGSRARGGMGGEPT